MNPKNSFVARLRVVHRHLFASKTMVSGWQVFLRQALRVFQSVPAGASVPRWRVAIRAAITATDNE